MKPMTATTLRAGDSSTRTPALTKASSQPKTPATWGQAARRLMDALMRSLACPHV